jgi:hypothetical protein
MVITEIDCFNELRILDVTCRIMLIDQNFEPTKNETHFTNIVRN